MSRLEQLTDAQLAGLKTAYKRSLKNRRKRAPSEHFPWHKIQDWVFKAPNLVANPIRVILAVGGNRSGKSKLAMGMLDEILRRESPINEQLMTTDKFTGEIRPKDDRDPLRVWIVPPTGEKFRQDWVNPADGMGIRHWMGDRYIDHRQSPDYVFYGKVPDLEPLDEDGDFDPSKCDIILGKCLAAGTPVWTTEGSKPIEEFSGGERVFGADGDPTSVLALHDNGEREVYEVVLSTGDTLRLTDDHRVLASRQMSGSRVNEVVPFSEVRNRNSFKWLMGSPAMQFPGRDLPLPPYYVGAMIGDGSIHKGDLRFTNVDQPVLDRVFRESGLEWVQYRADKPTYHATLGYHGPFRSPHMELMGDLVDVPCGEKFVPDQYKYASVNQRLDVLAGLIDTDGCASGGGLSFCSKSRRLVEDVKWLALSVGGRANHVREMVVNGESYWRVQLYVEVPCELDRKRCETFEDTRIRRIEEIRPAGVERVFDLEVESDDHLFIAGETPLVVHNSQDQKMETFEASEVDVAIFDEEPQNPDIVAATRMRLATSNGVLIFAFTPLHGLSWSYDKWWNPLIKQGQAEQYRDRCWIHAPGDDDMGAVIACQMGMADNPRAEVYAREYLNDPTTSEAEKAARVYGEYGFVEGALIEQLAGIDLVHPSPEHRTYVVDELPPDSAIDQWYLVADPNKSYGAVLSCIDHDGNLFFVAEHLRKSWPNRKHADSFKEMEKKYATGPVTRYADPGSAGAQAQIDLEDFGLYFDTVNRGPGSVSRSIKRLRGLAWVDPDHVHPITGAQGAPRVYFYAPGLVERRDQGGMSVVGSQLAEQMSQARQKENAPPDTPDKSSKKLDLFDCARYTADMAMTHGPSGQGDRNRKFDMSNRLPTDREFSKMHSMPDMSLGSAKLWLPEYDFSNL